MSTLLRRLLCLFMFSALLFNHTFDVQPAYAQTAILPGLTIPKPDLVVTSVVFNSNCSAIFTIKNIGQAPVTQSFNFTASPLYVPAWGPGGHTGWSEDIFGLAAGAITTQTWQTVRVFESSKINVFVDPQNQVSESNELNNKKSFPVPSHCQVWNS